MVIMEMRREENLYCNAFAFSCNTCVMEIIWGGRKMFISSFSREHNTFVRVLQDTFASVPLRNFAFSHKNTEI